MRGKTKTRYPESLKNQVLKELEAVGNVAVVSKKHGIPSSWYLYTNKETRPIKYAYMG